MGKPGRPRGSKTRNRTDSKKAAENIGPRPDPKPAPRKPPVRYTERLAKKICSQLAEGKFLQDICQDDKMPTHATVLRWVVENKEGFRDQFMAANQARAYGWAEQCVAIADGSDDLNKDKFRVETRQWWIGKMLPQVFGDRPVIEHQAPVMIGQVNQQVLAMGTEDVAKMFREIADGQVAVSEDGEIKRLDIVAEAEVA